MIGTKGRRTLLSPTNTFYTQKNLASSDLVSTIEIVLQSDKTLQLLAITIAQWSLAKHAFIAALSHHEVAATVSLWEDGSNERSVTEAQWIGIGV